MQTVEPLGGAVGLTITEEPALSETYYYGHESETERLLRKAGGDGTGTVICSQGGVIPDLLARVAAKDGVGLAEAVVAKKGSVWSLTLAGGKLMAAEYFPPMA